MKAFCEKVKGKIKPDEYLVLLKYLHKYSNGRITVDVLKAMVVDLLLGEYPDLAYEFLTVLNFSDGLTLTTVESAESSASNGRKELVISEGGVREINSCDYKIRLSTSSSFEKPNPESSPRDETQDHLVRALGFCKKVIKKTSSEDYLKLLKYLHDYGTGKITLVDLKIRMSIHFPDFIMDDFDFVLEFYTGLSRPSSESEREIINKGDLTKSYEFLPKHLSGIHGSCASELEKKVLNYCCFSKGSYIRFHKNDVGIHEKEFNEEEEDKLFERDLVRAWMISTKEKATKLFDGINEGKINPTMENVDEHFASYNFRFIEKMYGNSGSLMVYHLRHSPEAVLPVLIKRLNQMEISFLRELNASRQEAARRQILHLRRKRALGSRFQLSH